MTTTKAACIGMSTRVFFPEDTDPPTNKEAIETCKGCPVRVGCLTVAMKNMEEFGIWAGTTFAERKHIRRNKVDVRDYLSVTCGTVEGFYRHRRMNTATCQDCKDAYKIDMIHKGTTNRKGRR